MRKSEFRSKTCLFILGAHRSGTSALAGSFHKMGVDFGGHLIPGREGENALGFFEDETVLALNDEFLQDTHRTWDDIAEWSFGSCDSPRIIQYQNELSDLLIDRFGESDLWAIKDPRICRLIPIWNRMFKRFVLEPRFVITFRHFTEVAKSLQIRNGFSFEKSACLILHHILSAEYWTRGKKRVFTSYHNLIEQPEAYLESVAKRLKISWPNKQTRIELDSFIRKELRHHHEIGALDSDPFGRFGDCATSLQDLLNRSIGTKGDALASEYDDVASQFHIQLAQLDPLLLEITVDAQAKIGRLVDHVNRLSDLPEQTLRALEQSNFTIPQLDKEVSTLNSRIKQGSENLERLENKINEQHSKSVTIEKETAHVIKSCEDRIEGKYRKISDRMDEHTAWTKDFERTFDAKLGQILGIVDERVLSIKKDEKRQMEKHKSIVKMLESYSESIREKEASIDTKYTRMLKVLKERSYRKNGLKQGSKEKDSDILGMLKNYRKEIKNLEEVIGQRYDHIYQVLEERTDWIKTIDEELHRDRRTLMRAVEEVLQQRTEWIKSIDEDLHRDRGTLMRLVSGMEFHIERGNRLKYLISKGIRHPYNILPWFKGMLKRRYARGDVIHIDQPHLISPPIMISDQSLEFDNRINAISFQRHEVPEISIVIPVYNDITYTINCIESLSRIEEEVSFEVIIVDDASPDVDTSMLADIENVKWVRNEQNMGFIGACNRGASFASGAYLLFLNNDTVVHEGCITWLRDTFDIFPDSGIVGGKLVYPNGSLQEAGCIVWKDGSAWNYGRCDDPSAPQYNYARAVDYCSGALLLIRRELFNELGQFDTLYSPAYYEDTDLAFRVRDTGKKVYYQPSAVATHFEGVSCGIETDHGHKRYQVVNHDKFYRTWEHILQGHRLNGEFPELERERDVGKRILIIDHRVVTPDQDSGSMRMSNMMEIIQGLGYKVTFIPDNLYYHSPYTKKLQARGIEVIYGPYYKSVVHYLKLYGHLQDIVILSRLFVASKHIRAIRKFCKNAKVIFDTVDLHFVRETRRAETFEDSRILETARATKEQELELIEQTDMTFVVSTTEQDLLKRLQSDADVRVVSNIHAIVGCQSSFVERDDILFIGGFEHPPNIDAVQWFCAEILPVVREKIPSIRFHIIGSKPTEEIYRLAEDNIIVHGFVKEVGPLFEQCRITVAPLRYGAGIKGKVNQSLAHGVPCVATPVAVEGMYLNHREDVYIANTPKSFAMGVIEVYENHTLWQKLSNGGLKNTQDRFSFDAARHALELALNS